MSLNALSGILFFGEYFDFPALEWEKSPRSRPLWCVGKIQERTQRLESPAALDTRGTLGAVLAKQGKYVEAESELRAVLAVQERMVGKEHPNTLQTVHNLSATLAGQGKQEEARECARRAFDGAMKTLGLKHPNTKAYMKAYDKMLEAK